MELLREAQAGFEETGSLLSSEAAQERLWALGAPDERSRS
jgi:hypothetical protein